MKIVRNTLFQKIKLTVAIMLVGSSLFAPASALAAGSPFKNDACSGVSQVAGGGCNGSADTTINGALKNIVNILTFLVGVTAVIVIIIDGLKLAASNGDAQAAAAARSGIIYACVALAVVASAQVIVHFVLGHI